MKRKFYIAWFFMFAAWLVTLASIRLLMINFDAALDTAGGLQIRLHECEEETARLETTTQFCGPEIHSLEFENAWPRGE